MSTLKILKFGTEIPGRLKIIFLRILCRKRWKEEEEFQRGGLDGQTHPTEARGEQEQLEGDAEGRDPGQRAPVPADPGRGSRLRGDIRAFHKEKAIGGAFSEYSPFVAVRMSLLKNPASG